MANAAQLWVTEGQAEEASKKLDKAWRVLEENGVGPRQVLSALGFAVNALDGQAERPDLALPFAERALKITREIYGENSPENAFYLLAIARAQKDAGDQEQTKATILRALELYQIAVETQPDSDGVWLEGVAFASEDLAFMAQDREAWQESADYALQAAGAFGKMRERDLSYPAYIAAEAACHLLAAQALERLEVPAEEVATQRETALRLIDAIEDDPDNEDVRAVRARALWALNRDASQARLLAEELLAEGYDDEDFLADAEASGIPVDELLPEDDEAETPDDDAEEAGED
jgi:tetratricopeptide (TPR) repeat protein